MLSAAMIIKNEEVGIERALESVRGLSSEITILDTGSIDDTITLVMSLKDKWQSSSEEKPIVRIYHERWRNDFAWARNRAQELTCNDWLLVLDGDEVLEPGNIKELVDSVDDDIDGLLVKVVAEAEDAPETIYSIRVYRKSRGIWKYPVHNQLQGIRKVIPSTAVIRTSYVGVTEKKLKRSIPMLLDYFRHHNDDPHAPFFLAKSYMVAKDWDQVKHWSKICEKICPEAVEYAQFWCWYVQALLALGELQEAHSALETALILHPGFPDLWHLNIPFALAKWLETASNPGPYFLFAQKSIKILKDPKRISDVCEILDIPISLDIGEEKQ